MCNNTRSPFWQEIPAPWTALFSDSYCFSINPHWYWLIQRVWGDTPASSKQVKKYRTCLPFFGIKREHPKPEFCRQPVRRSGITSAKLKQRDTEIVTLVLTSFSIFLILKKKMIQMGQIGLVIEMHAESRWIHSNSCSCV